MAEVRQGHHPSQSPKYTPPPTHTHNPHSPRAQVSWCFGILTNSCPGSRVSSFQTGWESFAPLLSSHSQQKTLAGPLMLCLPWDGWLPAAHTEPGKIPQSSTGPWILKPERLPPSAQPAKAPLILQHQACQIDPSQREGAEAREGSRRTQPQSPATVCQALGYKLEVNWDHPLPGESYIFTYRKTESQRWSHQCKERSRPVGCDVMR